jgi:hypothetical protein
MPLFAASVAAAESATLPVEEEIIMLKKFILPFVFLVSYCGFAQTPREDDTTPATALSSATALSPAVLSNDELLIRDKAIFVVTESYFVKKEQLEQGLVNRKELGAWGMHVVNSEKDADMILKVERLPFQHKFAFTFTDRASSIVVMGGQVNSAFGTVAGKIAERLADRLKEIHKH